MPVGQATSWSSMTAVSPSCAGPWLAPADQAPADRGDAGSADANPPTCCGWLVGHHLARGRVQGWCGWGGGGAEPVQQDPGQGHEGDCAVGSEDRELAVDVDAAGSRDRPAQRPQYRHGRCPDPGAGQAGAEQVGLGGAEWDAGDEAHQGELAEAGAIADRPGANGKADADGDGGGGDPGLGVAEQAAGEQPLAGADDR